MAEGLVSLIRADLNVKLLSGNDYTQFWLFFSFKSHYYDVAVEYI